MAKKKYMIFFIGVLLVISAGCSTKEVTQPDINKYDVGIEMDNKEQISEGAKKTSNHVEAEPSKIPEAPRNQEEFEEMFGVVEESGTWIPPNGAYKDPRTGNIKNKDGVVISGGNETPHPARPGSKG